MRTRIAHIMQDKSLSASSLAEILGVQASGISHILSGRNNPSLDFIIRFLTKFSDVNADWFIMGKGDAYKSAFKQEVTDINNEKAIVIGDDKQHLSEYTTVSGYNKPVTANKVEADLFTVSPHSPTTPLNQAADIDTQGINNTNQESSKQEVSHASQTVNNKVIKRVMIFYSDHTVDSYEYCDK